MSHSRWVSATGIPKTKSSVTNRGVLFSADESQRLCRDRRRRKALSILCHIHSGRSPLNSNGRVPAHFVRRDFQNFSKTARACHNISNCGSYSVDVHPLRSCADRVKYSAAFFLKAASTCRTAQEERALRSFKTFTRMMAQIVRGVTNSDKARPE